MKEDKELLIHASQNESRILINVTLLGICFTIFGLIITIKPELFRVNTFLTVQLVCSIPLMLSCLFARSKLRFNSKADLWKKFSFLTFLLSYTFLVNVVGLLLIEFISLKVGLIFFGVNVLFALLYSSVEIYYDKKRLGERIVKDLFFIALVFFLGIMPTL